MNIFIDDIFYNILLHSNLADTIRLRSCNKHMTTICNNHFWYQKCILDGVDVDEYGGGDWEILCQIQYFRRKIQKTKKYDVYAM